MKTIPSVRGHRLWGHGADMMRDPLQTVWHLAEDHGGAAAFRAFHRRFVAVTDPAIIRHILVKNPTNFPRSYHYRNGSLATGAGLLASEGDEWRRHRRMIQPAFRSDPVRAVASVTAECWHEVADEWGQLAHAGQPVAVIEETQRLALAVIMRALTGTTPAAADAYRFGAAVKRSLVLARARNNTLLPMPTWMPTGANRRLWAIRNELDQFLGPTVAARRANSDGDDMISAMARARDPDGQAFTSAELLTETKTLFAAGFETTATTLAWALGLLAQDQDLCDRLAAEARAAGLATGVERDSVDRLPICARVVDEVLRLYPSVYIIARKASADDDFDGLRLPGGRVYLMSLYGMQRSALWQNPHRFDIDRWLPERKPPKQAFMPFALGPHTCIGNHFALVELRIALSLICLRFRFAFAPGEQLPAVRPQVTAVPAQPIHLHLSPRSQS